MKKLLFGITLIIASLSKLVGQISYELTPLKYSYYSYKSPFNESLTGDWIVRTIQFDTEGENIIYQQNIQAKLTQSNNEIKGKYMINGLPDFMSKFLFKGILENGMGYFEKIKVKHFVNPNNLQWCDAQSGKFKIVHLKGETFIIGNIINDASQKNTWNAPTYVLLRKKQFSYVTESEENNLIQNYIETNKISYQSYINSSNETFTAK